MDPRLLEDLKRKYSLEGLESKQQDTGMNNALLSLAGGANKWVGGDGGVAKQAMDANTAETSAYDDKLKQLYSHLEKQAGRDATVEAAETQRGFTADQSALSRSARADNAQAQRDWQSREKDKDRSHAQRIADKQTAHLKMKSGSGGPELSVGQKEVDKGAAKIYNEWKTSGGYAGVQKQLKDMRGAIKDLGTTDYASGPMVGLIPEKLRDVFTPTGRDIQQRVEGTVQTSLKAVLGAQFAQKEAEQLMSRAYNPRLSEEVNARRAEAIMQHIEQLAQAKEASMNYFEEHGTLVGYRGPRLEAHHVNSINLPGDSEMQGSNPADGSQQAAGGVSDSGLSTDEEEELRMLEQELGG